MNQIVSQKEKVAINVVGSTPEQTYKQTLDAVVKFFNDDTAANVLPSMLTKTYLTSYGKPCERWSIRNNVLMLIIGQTSDARTYRQWQEIGRYVKKGEHGFKLVAPVLARVDKVDEKTGETKTTYVFTGKFKDSVTFFSDFQTEGKPIVYVEKPKAVPPLMEVATKMGLKVNYDKTIVGEYGSFDPETDELRLCTEDVGTFFHELGHATHQRIAGHKLNLDRNSQEYKTQEVIAELTSCVLANIYGYDKKDYSYAYIKSYLNDNQKIGGEILKVVSVVSRILDEIFSVKREYSN